MSARREERRLEWTWRTIQNKQGFSFKSFEIERKQDQEIENKVIGISQGVYWNRGEETRMKAQWERIK